MTYISPEELDHIQTLRLINNIQKNTNKILNLINNNDISTTTLTSSINTGQHFTKERINQYYNDEIYNEEIKDEFNTSLPLLSSSSSSSTIIDNNNNNIEENYNQIKQNNIYLLNKYETNTLNNELNNNDSNNSILNNTITDLNNITNIIENNIFNIISQYNTIIKLSQEYKDAYLILINRNNIDNNLKNLLINTYQIYENSIIILKKIYVNRLKLKEELEKKLEDEKNELELLSSINIKSIEKAQFSDGILHENERIREENINKSLSTSSSFSSSSSLPFSPNSSSSPYPESPQVLYPPTTILASPLPPPSGSNFGSSSSSSSSTTAAATPYTSHLIEESTVDINETVSSSNFQSLLQDQKVSNIIYYYYKYIDLFLFLLEYLFTRT